MVYSCRVPSCTHGTRNNEACGRHHQVHLGRMTSIAFACLILSYPPAPLPLPLKIISACATMQLLEFLHGLPWRLGALLSCNNAMLHSRSWLCVVHGHSTFLHVPLCHAAAPFLVRPDKVFGKRPSGASNLHMLLYACGLSTHCSPWVLNILQFTLGDAGMMY